MTPTPEELAQAVASEAVVRLEESVKKIKHCVSQLDLIQANFQRRPFQGCQES